MQLLEVAVNAPQHHQVVPWCCRGALKATSWPRRCFVSARQHRRPQPFACAKDVHLQQTAPAHTQRTTTRVHKQQMAPRTHARHDAAYAHMGRTIPRRLHPLGPSKPSIPSFSGRRRRTHTHMQNDAVRRSNTGKQRCAHADKAKSSIARTHRQLVPHPHTRAECRCLHPLDPIQRPPSTTPHAHTQGEEHNGYRWYHGFMSHRICLVRVYTRTCYARGVCGWGYGIEKWYPRYTREVP